MSRFSYNLHAILLSMTCNPLLGQKPKEDGKATILRSSVVRIALMLETTRRFIRIIVFVHELSFVLKSRLRG